MDKTKKIIISLSIALAVLFVLNYIIISFTSSDYIEIPVFKEQILKGKQIESQDLTMIQVKRTQTVESLLQTVDIATIVGKTLIKDVSKGEVVTQEKLMDAEKVLEFNENYSYISIPITDLSYPTCNKLKQGDKVAIYYTAKSKDVTNAIKNKQRLYSNTVSEGLVTCLLFDSVEVISVHDSAGKETNETIITDILVRLEKEQAMLVANLKSQGTFDIVLN